MQLRGTPTEIKRSRGIFEVEKKGEAMSYLDISMFVVLFMAICAAWRRK